MYCFCDIFCIFAHDTTSVLLLEFLITTYLDTQVSERDTRVERAYGHHLKNGAILRFVMDATGDQITKSLTWFGALLTIAFK